MATEKGDSTVLGYPCHKATTRFVGDFSGVVHRGNRLSLWPVQVWDSQGWITCIYDTQGEYIYTLVGSEQAPSADYIYERALVHWLFETSEVFARLLRQYHE